MKEENMEFQSRKSKSIHIGYEKTKPRHDINGSCLTYVPTKEFKN